MIAPVQTLLIEDNAPYAELLKEMLAPDGFSVAHAPLLATGLEKLQQDSFQLAIVDLMLPDAEGTAACEAVRVRAPALPIVVISGVTAEEEFELQCLKKGAQDFLRKGAFDRVFLVRSLKYAMQRKELEMEYRAAQNALVEANRKLLEKVNELDRLNKIMMDREERILELKEQLKKKGPRR